MLLNILLDDLGARLLIIYEFGGFDQEVTKQSAIILSGGNTSLFTKTHT